MAETQGPDESKRSGFAVADKSSEAPVRHPYTPPRVLSAEMLEAAAATCDGSGGYGKTIPVPCGTAGS